jgi:hypothetical protein
MLCEKIMNGKEGYSLHTKNKSAFIAKINPAIPK